MNSVAYFVGLDYHQERVQVCVLDPQGRPRLNRACRNDWQAIAQAVAGVGPVRAAAAVANRWVRGLWHRQRNTALHAN